MPKESDQQLEGPTKEVTRPELKLFPDSEPGPTFFQHLELFTNLEPNPRQKVLDFFVQRPTPYLEVAPEEHEQLKALTQATEDELSALANFIPFLLVRLAAHTVTLEEISSDLKTLNRSDSEIDALKSFFEEILRRRSDLHSRTRQDFAAIETVPFLQSLAVSLDIRVIHGEKDEIIDAVPVLLVRIKLKLKDSEHVKEDIVFQLNEQRLANLCKLLTGEQKKMTEAAKHFSSAIKTLEPRTNT